MTRDAIDECDYRGGSTPEAMARCVEYLRQRAAETADERLRRYQRLDRLREFQEWVNQRSPIDWQVK